MIEQIRVGDKLEIIFSIEEGCRLVRDNYSEELGDLLLHTFDKLIAQSEKNNEAYEELLQLREECEEDIAIAESNVTQIRQDIEHIIDFTLDYIEISDEDKKTLTDALEKAIEV